MKLTILLASFAIVHVIDSFPLQGRAASPTVIDLAKQITFIGNSSHGVESFLNIKFGQDTSGDNRFKAPQSFSYPPNTVVNASVPGAACPQQEVPVKGIPIFSNVTNISEDCLNLRIDRPANVTADAKLPVMVYIYGGGLNVGQIYDQAYTPTGLVASAAAKRIPVIYVAMNYRVGIFGFASTPDISQDDLNSGLLDQRLALQWVQENIHLFGGDPENVTVFGESAGANSIGLHLVSYAGNNSLTPPFHRAIMQSGGPTSRQDITSNITAIHTATVIAAVNCTSTTNNHTDELSCLRAVSLPTLLAAAVNLSLTLNPFGGFGTFSPVVPSKILPSAPSQLLASGQFHKNISLISGWTEDDGSLFVPSPAQLQTEADLIAWLQNTTSLTSSAITTALSLYPPSSFPPTDQVSTSWQRASQIERDSGGTCGSLLINAAMANASSANTTNYLYALNVTLFEAFFAAANASYFGVSHFSDIPFVFDQAAYPAYGASVEEIELSGRVSASWARFALDGVAGGGNETVGEWTAGAEKGRSDVFGVRVLGGPGDGMKITSLSDGDWNGGEASGYGEDLVARCRFWNSAELLDMQGT